MWGAVGSLGIAAGVLFGGALTTWAGWQIIFWVNVPIGAGALAVGLKVIPEGLPPAPASHQFDVPGASPSSAVSAPWCTPSARPRDGWLPQTVSPRSPSQRVLFTAFAYLELRTATPLVPPHTWRVGTLVVRHRRDARRDRHPGRRRLPDLIFLQTVLGFSALRAGLAFLPLRSPSPPAPPGPQLLAHDSPRALAAAGLVLAAAGSSACPPLARPALRRRRDARLLVLGLGVGLVFVPVSVTAMAGIPAQHAGMASGFLMTGHEVGAALGVAVLSAVATTAGSLTNAPARRPVSPAVCSRPPSSLSSSVSWPTCGCPPPGWTAPPRCTCTTELDTG